MHVLAAYACVRTDSCVRVSLKQAFIVARQQLRHSRLFIYLQALHKYVRRYKVERHLRAIIFCSEIDNVGE